jgi:hypothetical protein
LSELQGHSSARRIRYIERIHLIWDSNWWLSGLCLNQLRYRVPTKEKG